MYENAGKSIKSIVTVFVAIGSLLSVFVGLSIIGLTLKTEDPTIGKTYVFIGFGAIAVGCFLFWLLGLLIYAYGQLIENTDKLVEICDRMAHSDSKVADNLVEIKEKLSSVTVSGSYEKSNV